MECRVNVKDRLLQAVAQKSISSHLKEKLGQRYPTKYIRKLTSEHDMKRPRYASNSPKMSLDTSAFIQANRGNTVVATELISIRKTKRVLKTWSGENVECFDCFDEILFKSTLL